MKKLFVIAALVAGPILYAQQKPSTAVEQNKVEVIKADQAKVSQDSQKITSNSSKVKSVNKKTRSENTETKTTTNKKSIHAKSFNETIEN